MNARMQAAILPGGRLHLNDGPIDLVIGADGARSQVRAAYAAAPRRFADVLDELCDELPLLRAEMRRDAPLPSSPVARRMDAAVRPLCGDRFVTRMAAVAGAVADEILSAMCGDASLSRAYVNNGGDIAIHLAPGTRFDMGLATPDQTSPSLLGTAIVSHADPVRGVATSGRGGRSFSLGIADNVTVLARDAACADAVATLVANAVDLPGHPAVARCPACDLDPQSDLGSRLVTRGLGALLQTEVSAALEAGAREAERLRGAGHLVAAALSLHGAVRIVGPMPAATPELRRHAV